MRHGRDNMLVYKSLGGIDGGVAGHCGPEKGKVIHTVLEDFSHGAIKIECCGEPGSGHICTSKFHIILRHLHKASSISGFGKPSRRIGTPVKRYRSKNYNHKPPGI